MIFEMSKNDRFILSKGHASLALYVILNYLKKITDKELSSYFQDGTNFGVHPPSTLPNHIPLATGSLGHGLSFAAGLAKGYKLLSVKQVSRVFCLISDGECNEGAVWEAAMFASHNKLDNLVLLIDKNGYQATGRTKDVLGDGASSAKWKAFGFNTFQVDGHSLIDLDRTFKAIKKISNHFPSVMICKTVRGKGIPEIEDTLNSNYFHMSPDSYKKALHDVELLK